MLKTIATMEPQKVGEPAVHAIVSGSSDNASIPLVRPPVSLSDQAMKCANCKASFLRKDGCCDHGNLRDYVSVVLCPKCFAVAEIQTVQ